MVQDNKLITGFIQNGRTLQANGAGLDLDKPFSTLFDDGSTKFSSGATVQQPAPVQAFPPNQVPVPLAQPPVDPSDFVVSPTQPLRPALPAPVVPATTPLVPELQTSAPPPPQITPNLGDPILTKERLDKAKERALGEINNNLGLFVPGNSIIEIIREGFNEDDNGVSASFLERLGGKEAVREFSNIVYDVVVSDEALRFRFKNLAAVNAQVLGPQAEFQYNKSLDSDPTGRELFSSLLVDFVTVSPEATSPEIIQFYKDVGLIQDAEADTFAQVVSVPRVYQGTIEELEILFDHRGIQRDLAEATFAGSLLPFEDGRALGEFIPVFEIGVMLSIQNIVRTNEIRSEKDYNRIDEIRVEFSQTEGANPDMVLFQLTAEEIDLGRRSYRSLRKLSEETYLQALLVLQNEVIISAVDQAASIKDRKIAGLTTPAEEKWFALGLTDNQIGELSHFVGQGLRYNTTRQLEEIREQTDKEFEAEALALPYLVDDKEIPEHILKDVSPAFISDYALKGPGADFSLFTAPFTVPKNALTSGIVANPIGWGLDRMASIGEHYSDKRAERYLSDPYSQVGFPYGNPWVQDFADKIGEGSDNEFARQALFGNDPLGIQEKTGTFLAEVTIKALNIIGQGETVIVVDDFTEKDYADRGSLSLSTPQSLPGGQIRKEMQSIYFESSKEDRFTIEDSAATLFLWVTTGDGRINLTHAEEFIRLVREENLRVPDALSRVNEMNSLIYLVLTDTLNILDFLPIKALSKGIIAPGYRALNRVPGSVGGSSILVRSGDILKPADDKLIQKLLTSERVIEKQLDEGYATVTRLLTENEATEHITTITRKLDEGLEVRKMREELDEIKLALLDVKNENIHTFTREVRGPGSGLLEFSTGTTVADAASKAKALRKNRTIASSDQLMFEDELISIKDPEQKVNNIMGRLPVINRLWDKTGEGARRSLATSVSLDVVKDFQHILSVAGTPLRKLDGTIQTHKERFKELLEEIIKVGSTRNFNSIRRFVDTNRLDSVLTRSMARSVEMLSTIDIKKIATLADDVVIAGSEEDFLRLIEAGADANKVFTTPVEFIASTLEEVISQVGRNIVTRYGLDPDKIGAALRIQNGLNGAASAIFLEHMGFLVRNFGGNNTAAAMDGINLMRMNMMDSKLLREFTEQIGVEPLSIGFNVSSNTTGRLADVTSKQKSVWKSLLGINSGYSLKTRLKGGGIPFIGGGLPGTFIRDASAAAEQMHRSHIQIIESLRVFDNIVKPKLVLDQLAIRNPRLAEKLSTIDPQGALAKGITDAIASGQSDQIFTVIDEISVLDQLQVADELLARIQPTVNKVMDAIGFHPEHVNEVVRLKVRTLLNDVVPDAARMSDEIDEMLVAIDEAGLAVAEIAGVPAAVHKETMEFFDEVFTAAKGSGMSPKNAGDVANIITHTLSMRMKGIFERLEIMKNYVSDPELYHNHQFGIRADMTDEQALDMIRFGTGQGGSRSIDFIERNQDLFVDDMVEAVIEDVGTIKGIDEIGTRSERLRRNQNIIQTALSRSRGRDVIRRRVDPMRSMATEWKDEFSFTWTKPELDRKLDKFLDTLVEVSPGDFKFTPNSVKNYLHGVRRKDIKRAIDRAITRGSIQRTVFDQKRFVDDAGLIAIAGKGEDVAFLPAKGRPLVDDATTKAMTQFTEDLEFLTRQITDRDISAAAGGVRSLELGFNQSRQALMRKLTSTMTEFFNQNSFIGMVDNQVANRANPLLNSLVDDMQAMLRRNIEKYNALSQRMRIPPTAIDHEELAAAQRKYVWYNQPTEYSSWVADNAPSRSFIERSKDVLVKNAAESNKEWQAATTAFEGQASQNLQLPRIETVTDKSVLGAEKHNTTQDLIDWARNPTPALGPEVRLEGFKNRMHEISEYWANAKVAVIPDDVNVAPANIGMGTRPISGVPRFGIQGRVFQQTPPEGFRSFITGDDFIIDAKDPFARHNRIAVFVREGTSEEEVIREVVKLSTENAKLLTSQTKLDKLVELSGSEQFRLNPTGYHASFQLVSPEQVETVLAKYVKLSEAEGITSFDALAARRVIQQANSNWRRGWPLTGVSLRGLNPAQLMSKLETSLDDMFRQWKSEFKINSHFEDVTYFISKQDGVELNSFIDDMIKEMNGIKVTARDLGRAKADFVLHDYLNNYDIDFLLRWIGPWHIWPTRTAAKMTLRLLDNPQWISRFSRFNARVKQNNNNLPEWAQDQIPIEWLLGPLGIFGAELSGAVVDPSGILFHQDLIQDFKIGNPADFNLVGKIYDGYENYGVINPAWTFGLAAMGAFGDDVDLLQTGFGGLVKPGEIFLQLLDKAHLMPDAVPTQIVFTQSDRFNLTMEYAVSLMDATTTYGPNSKQANDIIDSWDRWAVNGIPPVPLIEYAQNLIVNKVPRDPIFDSLLKASQQGRFTSDITSSLGGFRVGTTTTDRQEFFDLIAKFGKLADDFEFKSEAEKDAAYQEFFENHPAVGLYFSNKSDEQSSVLISNARSEWLGGDAADIRVSRDRQIANVGPLTHEDPEILRERIEEVNRIKLEATAELDEVHDQILEDTGIDIRKHPAFNIQYRYGDEEARRVLEKFILYDLPQIGEGDRRVASEIVRDLLNERKGDDPAWQWVSAAETEEFLKKFGEDWERQRGRPFNTDFVDVGALNAFILQDYATGFVLEVDDRLELEKVRLEKQGWGITNAFDFEEFSSGRELIFNRMPEEERGFYLYNKSRSDSLVEAVDFTISDIIGENTSKFWGQVFWKGQRTETEAAAALKAVIDNYTPPTPEQIYERMDEDRSGLWQDYNGATKDDIIDMIRVRLDNTDLGNLMGIIEGRYERRVENLRADHTRLEKLKEAGDEEALLEFEGNRTRENTGRMRHFMTPSGRVVTDLDELEEFERGLIIWKELADLADENIFIPLHPVSDNENDINAYFKWFKKDGVDRINQQALLDFAFDELDDADLAFAMLDIFRGGTGDEKPSDAFNPDGSVRQSEFGIPSSGRSVPRLNSKYRVDNIPFDVALSTTAQSLKIGLGTFDFAGRFETNIPPDYVWEHMARNGVNTTEEIIDYFWSLFEAFEGIHGPSFQIDELVTPILVESQNENVTIARFRWLKGIEGILSTVFGFPRSSTTSSGTSGVSGSSGVGRTIKPRAEANIGAISSRGAGGLPMWTEATRHMENVFQDPTLLRELLKFFRNSNNKLTKNHRRMLKLMSGTFPIPAAKTFDQWLEALKLMWETASLIVDQPARETIVNPSGGGGFRTPRRARFQVRNR